VKPADAFVYIYFYIYL